MSGGFALAEERRKIVDFAFSSYFPMRIPRRPADHRKHPRLDQRYSTYTRQLQVEKLLRK